MLSLLAQAYALFLTLLALGMLGISSRNYVQEQVSNNYRPKTLVIVPCKGIDLTLEENLNSLIRQDYGNYRVVCVVDAKSDASLPLIKKLKIDYLISGKKYPKASGKVRAIASAIKKNKDYPVYVIADSDVTFGREWLRKIVMPLKDGSCGLSTSYPFFNPMGGFWSKVKSSWGLVGEGLMESQITRFGWGGSLAFCREMLGPRDFDFFSSSLSDDIALTAITKKRGLKIFYRNDTDIVVNSKETFSTFFEWANRQTALSIKGNRRVFYFGVAFYLAQILLTVSGIVMAILVSPLFILLLAPILYGIFKNYRRLRKKYPEFFAIQLFLPFIYFANLLIANSLRTIEWRGKSYELG
ncbi:MAG: glycosyltransferase family 2 protein [Candidatus Micrarchaeota archaeon]|nr:glycosyltransferase family 2 protein [Candidatus Micrarchaeota archaeon]MDE1864633.1 glycosyltransferase family 2 protein [Candidatus Micrarchaeota archaeon]